MADTGVNGQFFIDGLDVAAIATLRHVILQAIVDNTRMRGSEGYRTHIAGLRGGSLGFTADLPDDGTEALEFLNRFIGGPRNPHIIGQAPCGAEPGRLFRIGKSLRSKTELNTEIDGVLMLSADFEKTAGSPGVLSGLCLFSPNGSQSLAGDEIQTFTLAGVPAIARLGLKLPNEAAIVDVPEPANPESWADAIETLLGVRPSMSGEISEAEGLLSGTLAATFDGAGSAQDWPQPEVMRGEVQTLTTSGTPSGIYTWDNCGAFRPGTAVNTIQGLFRARPGNSAVIVDGESSAPGEGLFPRGPVLLNSHPINAGMVRRFALREETGLDLTDLCGNADLTAEGDTPPTWGMTGGRQHLEFYMGNSRLIGSDTGLPAGNADFTLALELQFDLGNFEGYYELMHLVKWGDHSLAEAYNWVGFRYDYDAEAGALGYSNDLMTPAAFLPATWEPETAGFHVLTARGAGSTVSLWLDGVKVAEGTRMRATALQGAGGFVIGDYDNSYQSWGGVLRHIAIWERALSDAEIDQFSANPQLGLKSDVEAGAVVRLTDYDRAIPFILPGVGNNGAYPAADHLDNDDATAGLYALSSDYGGGFSGVVFLEPRTISQVLMRFDRQFVGSEECPFDIWYSNDTTGAFVPFTGVGPDGTWTQAPDSLTALTIENGYHNYELNLSIPVTAKGIYVRSVPPSIDPATRITEIFFNGVILPASSSALALNARWPASSGNVGQKAGTGAGVLTGTVNQGGTLAPGASVVTVRDGMLPTAEIYNIVSATTAGPAIRDVAPGVVTSRGMLLVLHALWVSDVGATSTWIIEKAPNNGGNPGTWEELLEFDEVTTIGAQFKTIPPGVEIPAFLRARCTNIEGSCVVAIGFARLFS